MRPKIVFFDCDGVLVTLNTWVRILNISNISVSENDRLYKSYYAGKISFIEFIEIETNLLKKSFTKEKYHREIVEKLEINSEAFEIITHLKNASIPIAIISSGEKTYIEVVAKKLKIETFRVNTYFNFDKNGCFTHLNFHAEDPIAKVDQVNEICKMFDCLPEETFFVGDSNNDLKAFELTKHGLLYKNKDKKCVKAAWKTIRNLNEIKNLIY